MRSQQCLCDSFIYVIRIIRALKFGDVHNLMPKFITLCVWTQITTLDSYLVLKQ